MLETNNKHFIMRNMHKDNKADQIDSMNDVLNLLKASEYESDHHKIAIEEDETK